jgi:hypothetical protein
MLNDTRVFSSGRKRQKSQMMQADSKIVTRARVLPLIKLFVLIQGDATALRHGKGGTGWQEP